MNFRTLIRVEAAEINRLNARIYETLASRSEGKKGYDEWSEACRQFHEHESKINSWLVLVLENSELSDPVALEFSIQFLEEDPKFFRSGYIKEALITKIKRAPLTESQCERVSNLLLNAVLSNGRREFRRYCRLAMKFQSTAFTSKLTEFIASEDAMVRSRAKMMLRYVRSVNSGQR